MDSTGFIIFLLYWCLCGWRANIVYGQSNNFNVTDFGAVADGQTDSSKVRSYLKIEHTLHCLCIILSRTL